MRGAKCISCPLIYLPILARPAPPLLKRRPRCQQAGARPQPLASFRKGGDDGAKAGGSSSPVLPQARRPGALVIESPATYCNGTPTASPASSHSSPATPQYTVRGTKTVRRSKLCSDRLMRPWAGIQRVADSSSSTADRTHIIKPACFPPSPLALIGATIYERWRAGPGAPCLCPCVAEERFCNGSECRGQGASEQNNYRWRVASADQLRGWANGAHLT